MEKKFQIPKDLPPEKGQRVRLSFYVDVDHAHDLVTRRSITGILSLINNTPIRWLSKRQKTVGAPTYGSRSVASRMTIKLILKI
jgi:hypothetical protein